GHRVTPHPALQCRSEPSGSLSFALAVLPGLCVSPFVFVWPPQALLYLFYDSPSDSHRKHLGKITHLTLCHIQQTPCNGRFRSAHCSESPDNLHGSQGPPAGNFRQWVCFEWRHYHLPPIEKWSKLNI